MEIAEEKEIVIVGGGICGLATALALHRKGISSVVLERSDRLRATGAAIIIQPNGWRALDQLGVAAKLRQTAILIQNMDTMQQGLYFELFDRNGELRCLKRSHLIETMADDIPVDTIRLGCRMLSIELDPLTSSPVLRLHDGSILKAKVVIGCDGVNSLIAKFLGMNSTKLFSTCVVRGFRSYQRGHEFENEFLIMSREHIQFGRMPINDKLVYWFVTRKWTTQDLMVFKDWVLIRESTLESMRGFPTEIVEMIKNSEPDSFILTPLKYRAPWDLLRRSSQKGTVMVAGDAWHATGPFLAQGGSASLEDAIVLARCLAQNLCTVFPSGRVERKMVETAVKGYARERKMRVVQLCTQSYLIGIMLDDATSTLVKFISIVLTSLLFGDPTAHTYYDCGRL
ncbi:hypothetical protein L1049_025627 [Liquidambar formosana]|uniref:FAD-binding domain-containing protein n=1 Tax=Liquidambar formosana TaxID=63359 RepID=A0AAP0NEY3_LIQFO